MKTNNAQIKQEEFVELRTQYKQEKYNLLQIIILLQIIFLFLLFGFIGYQLKNEPKPIFFHATEEQQIIEPVPLSESYLSSAEVLNYVVEAIRVSYAFNYHSIDNHVKIFDYFDKRGIHEFFQVAYEKLDIKNIKNEQLIISAKIKAAPKIINEGIIKGIYVWNIVVPIELTYDNIHTHYSRNLDVNLYIWRVNTQESPRGVKITKFSVDVKNIYGK